MLKGEYYKIRCQVKRKKNLVPQIMTLEETMQKIINDRLSVARFGDGEMKWILGIKQNSFQENNSELQDLLKKTITCRREDILVCLPDIFDSLEKYNKEAQWYWYEQMYCYRDEFEKVLDKKYTYGNAFITRYYMDYIKRGHVKTIVSYWKQLFSHRNIIIVEGEFSRLGVGNDLFEKACSVNRIIAPAKNAFSVYEKIIAAVGSLGLDYDFPLVLLALGPTATVLVSPLTDMGYQTVDIGHFDVEYEWWKKKAERKIPLEGRYVNEAGGFYRELPAVVLDKYKKEILVKIMSDK